MHISCPYCSTIFDLKMRELGTVGRQVECSICEHQWFVDPSLYKGLPDSDSDIAIDIYLDSDDQDGVGTVHVQTGTTAPGRMPSLLDIHRTQVRKLRTKHAVITVFWAFLLMVTFSMVFYVTIYRDQFAERFPSWAKIYRTIRIDVDDNTNIRSFAVKNPQLSIQFRSNQRILHINAEIENIGTQPAEIPPLLLSLSNIYGHETYTTRIRMSALPLAPNEIRPFDYTIFDFPDNAKEIFLVFLNRSEDLYTTINLPRE